MLGVLKPAGQFICIKLIDCIKILLLNPCFQIQFFCRYDTFNFVNNSICSAVTIRYGRQNFLLAFIKQNIVNAPSINSNCTRYFANFFAFCNTFFYLADKMLYIPHKCAVLICYVVFKSVYFLKF